MKKFSIIAAVILCLGLILCMGSIASAHMGFRSVLEWLGKPVHVIYDRESKDIELVTPSKLETPQEQTYTASGDVTELEIAGISENIRLERTPDTDRVRITYTESYMHQYEITEQNGRLTFGYKAVSSINFGIDFTLDVDFPITVELPADYNPEILRIETTSGEIEVPALKAESVTLSTVSGEVFLESVETGKFALDSTSGSFEGSFHADTAEIGTISGDITLNNCAAREFEFESTSGSLHGGLKADEANFGTVSGDVRLDLDTRDAEFDFTSGEMELSLMGKPSEYGVEADTVSSDLIMNGEKLDDRRAEGNFTFDDEGYPQMVSEYTREKAPRQLCFEGVSGDIYLTAGK